MPATPRASGHELMDDADADANALVPELRFLRVLNRLTSAAAAASDVICRELNPRSGASVSVADFGAGSADIGRGFMAIAGHRGWRVTWTATDRSDAALAAGRGGAPCPGLVFAHADVLSADTALGPRSHDVAHASLVLHHLADLDVVRALHAMGTVARRLVVWNDLVRDRAGVAGARLSTLLASRQLRHDAVLSVRRGFTLDEAEAFAEAAGLRVRSLRRWRHGPRFILAAEPAGEPVHGARPVIRGHEIDVSFGARPILRSASIVVRSGEVCALVGPNGAGKTTLLRTLAGAIRPDAGRAWCDRSRSPLGYLPQMGGLVSSCSARRNVEFALRASGTASVPAREAADVALDRFGVAALESRRCDSLSVGQARRVALACAFAGAPAAILLDEPEAGLDDDGRERLVRAVEDAARRGSGMLVATHDQGLLREACSRMDVAFRVHRVEAA